MERLFSWKQPKPTKTAAVIRYGAYGDLLQSASILPGLKREGFHVTFFCTPRGVEVVKHDPNIDRFVIQDEDMVPNHELGDYFKYLAKTYTRVINLCEAVEGVLLPFSGKAHFHWPKEARHKVCNQNYVEVQHAIAGVPYNGPETKFYATDEEREWAWNQARKAPGRIVAWALSGSGAHKVWPHVDHVVANLLRYGITVVFLGGNKEREIEGDWDHQNVWRRCGEWSIRQSLAFAQVADVVVGPETGVLNAVATEPNAKVVILSHSTSENLTRDWVNTTAIHSKEAHCYPCHRLLLEGWEGCNRHEKGTALCQWTIGPEEVFNAIANALQSDERKAA